MWKYADSIRGVDPNIFKVSYTINFTDLAKAEEVKNTIEKLENVAFVNSSDETAEKLIDLAKGIRIGTFVILICLIIFAVSIIMNIIRLTVHSRRREISIMKYVGATNGFIRWPFAVEGMIIGLVSGLISTGLLAAVYSIIGNSEWFIAFINKIGLTLLNFSDMVNLVILVYMVLGIGIGAIGSSISMRKYLKV